MQSECSKIKQELDRIILQLLDEVIEDENEAYWETLAVSLTGVKTKVTETIYSGNSGILLFFVELYRNHPDPRYLELIRKSCHWLVNYCKANPTTHYAFYTGRMGAAYTLLKVYELLEEETFFEQALEITKDCMAMLDQLPPPDIDLINGVAGVILVLMHIYNQRPSEDILQKISMFTTHLLNQTYINQNGIYWDRSKKIIKGLCGLSHGTSGIGWVLLEAGKLFNDRQLTDLSYQTIHYENVLYDKEMRNWPDFRKDLYDDASQQRYFKAYQDNDTTIFEKPNNMQAWCHGSPGIGLGRIRFYELTGYKIANADIRRALNSTQNQFSRNTNRPVNILCHGTGGNAVLFIQEYLRTRKTKHLDLARDTALQIIKNYEAEGLYYSGYFSADKAHDTSLFMGLAGIGYFMLMCLYPTNTHSYLLPAIHAKRNFEPYLPVNFVTECIVNRLYPNTVKQTGIPDDVKLAEKKLLKTIVRGMKIKTVETGWQDSYRLETRALKKDVAIRSFCYDFIKTELSKKQAANALTFNAGKFEKLKLQVPENIIVSRIREQVAVRYLLIRIDYEGRKSYFINELNYQLLRQAKKAITVEELKSNIVERIANSHEEVSHVLTLLDLQIRELLKAGFISLA